MSVRIGSLCSGYRGLDMAIEETFGGTTAWVSDVDAGANKILTHHWPTVPNIGDLTTAKWDDVEPVDILCGGYPCQPFSVAGTRKGTADDRHLWPFIANALRVLRPRIAIFENVANHLRLGFDTVLTDLADIGFDAEWITVRADRTVGAPHQRRRLFFLATAQDPDSTARGQRRIPAPRQAESRGGTGRHWRTRSSTCCRRRQRRSTATTSHRVRGPRSVRPWSRSPRGLRRIRPRGRAVGSRHRPPCPMGN